MENFRGKERGKNAGRAKGEVHTARVEVGVQGKGGNDRQRHGLDEDHNVFGRSSRVTEFDEEGFPCRIGKDHRDEHEDDGQSDGIEEIASEFAKGARSRDGVAAIGGRLRIGFHISIASLACQHLGSAVVHIGEANHQEDDALGQIAVIGDADSAE